MAGVCPSPPLLFSKVLCRSSDFEVLDRLPCARTAEKRKQVYVARLWPIPCRMCLVIQTQFFASFALIFLVLVPVPSATEFTAIETSEGQNGAFLYMSLFLFLSLKFLMNRQACSCGNKCLLTEKKHRSHVSFHLAKCLPPKELCFREWFYCVEWRLLTTSRVYTSHFSFSFCQYVG